MFIFLFLFLRIKRLLSILSRCQLLLFQFPQLFGQDMGAILILKLDMVKLFYGVLNDRLDLLNLLFHLIIYSHFIHLFLYKFDHQSSVFIGPFVLQIDGVQVDGLIKDDVFDLAFRLTQQVSQLIVVEEKELEFDAVIFHEFDVVRPVSTFFRNYFCHGAIGLQLNTVLDQDKALFHEYFVILFVGQESHLVDSHQGISQGIVDQQIFYVSGCLSCLDSLYLLLFDCLEEYFRVHFLVILCSLSECLDTQDYFSDGLPGVSAQLRLDIIAIEVSQV